ncbi:MAG: long-chain fatty acid--CoA ligase [Pseudomonadota bacterium]
MELTQILHRALQRGPTRIAVVDGEQRRSYAQLQDRAARLATHLRALGVQPGDRVGLLGRNCVEAIELMFACWWSGAVFCPQNTRWSEAELADALGDCAPAVLFADTQHEAQARALMPRVPCLRHLVLMDDAAGPGHYPALLQGLQALPDHRAHGSDLAALIYTGGTTGRSKGVMLTHTNLVAIGACRLADNEPFHDSVALLSTPIFHVAAVTRMLPHLMAGGTLVLMPQFDAATAMALIEREGVTDAPLVPTMLQMILDHPDFRPERLRSVLRLNYGSAPSANTLLRHAQRVLPWAGLYQYYGMTESSAVGTMSYPRDHDEEDWASGHANSAGQVCALIEMRVVDLAGKDVPPGTVGEIVLRGPTVSPGYWKRPQETAATFRDGWLHTGDAGKLDEGGYLYVVDRVKDMIVSGGENVYSAEVENALAQHPAVSIAAVIGIPHERWGEAVHAVIVVRPGLAVTEDEIKAHCRALIAGYKLPKSVEFLDQLPLTPAGKIAKNKLREKYWAGYARRVN